MRNFVLLAILFFVSSIIHWALASAFASFDIAVNFMLAVSVSVCVFFGKWSGYTFAFFGGLFLDFFGVNMFGGYALTFTVCAGLVYMFKRKMDFEIIPSHMIIIFLISIIGVLVYDLVGVIFMRGTAWHGFKSLILGSLVNVVVSPLIFYVMAVLRAVAAAGRKG